MSSNKTDSELPVAEDCEGRETFPIYLLSFVYSLLAVSGCGKRVHEEGVENRNRFVYS